MAAGTTPIFLATPRSSWTQIGTSAVTGTDGTDANVKTVFTAGANGSKIEDVYLVPSGTNSSDSTIRFWVNNGSTAGTATNNTLIHEETLLASTISQTAKSAATIRWPANLVLPAGYKLLVAAGTALAGNAACTAVGGDY